MPQKLPPRHEFKIGCKLYQIDEYGPEGHDEQRNTVKLDVSFGFKRRDGVALPDDFEMRVIGAVQYLLTYYLGSGLEEAGLSGCVMPDYSIMKVELEEDVQQASVLPTVPHVKEDSAVREHQDKLDS